MNINPDTPKDNRRKSNNNNLPVGSTKSKEQLKAERILQQAQAKDGKKTAKLEQRRKDGKTHTGPKAYLKDTATEMRASHKPDGREVGRWSMIVLLTIGVFAAFCAIIDNFISTPLIYWISGLNLGDGSYGPTDLALTIALFVFGAASAIGVMLHQGGESEGLSDSLATKLTGGSGQAQKNLNRITLICIVLFILTAIAMMIVFPQGSIIASS